MSVLHRKWLTNYLSCFKSKWINSYCLQFFKKIVFFNCVSSVVVCTGSSLPCGLSSGCRVQASHWRGLSCCRAWALGHTAFGCCGSQALEHRLSSRGTRALLLCSVWDLPESGTEPMSPGLADGFFFYPWATWEAQMKSFSN